VQEKLMAALKQPPKNLLSTMIKEGGESFTKLTIRRQIRKSCQRITEGACHVEIILFIHFFKLSQII
jgi:hypothetical protein